MTGGAVDALLLLIPCAPLLLACAIMLRPMKPLLLMLAPWAAAPALIASFAVAPESAVHLPWLLLGTKLGIDSTARVFLFFTALLWLAAGVFATAYLKEGRRQARFFTFFLFAMAGNLGLIVAEDMLSFYTFFALMSFASYGLVVHDRTPEARRAGRIYIVLVIAGEGLLFAAMVVAADAAGSVLFEQIPAAVAEAGTRGLILSLALSGLGIKLGVLGLHVWLPLAHPVAPTPASAVLSGAMIKAGLLGWLRLLPLGEATLPGWGGALIVLGLAAAFYAVVVGISQRNPKIVLAYSSVSQMGLVTAGVGLGLTAPAKWPEISAVVLLLALHHALAKSALFLGAGISAGEFAANGRRWLVAAGLSVPALALAGMPFTSGGLAKAMLKAEAAAVASPWGELLSASLPWTGVAITVLMARFLYLAWPRASTMGARLAHRLAAPWVVLIVALMLVPISSGVADTPALWTWSATMSDLAIPAIGGALAAIGAWVWAKLGRHRMPVVSAGDLVVPVEWGVRLMVGLTGRAMELLGYGRRRAAAMASGRLGQLGVGLGQGGSMEYTWGPACLLFLVLILVLVFLMAI